MCRDCAPAFPRYRHQRGTGTWFVGYMLDTRVVVPRRRGSHADHREHHQTYACCHFLKLRLESSHYFYKINCTHVDNTSPLYKAPSHLPPTSDDLDSVRGLPLSQFTGESTLVGGAASVPWVPGTGALLLLCLLNGSCRNTSPPRKRFAAIKARVPNQHVKQKIRLQDHR